MDVEKSLKSLYQRAHLIVLALLVIAALWVELTSTSQLDKALRAGQAIVVLAHLCLVFFSVEAIVEAKYFRASYLLLVVTPAFWAANELFMHQMLSIPLPPGGVTNIFATLSLRGISASFIQALLFGVSIGAVAAAGLFVWLRGRGSNH